MDARPINSFLGNDLPGYTGIPDNTPTVPAKGSIWGNINDIVQTGLNTYKEVELIRHQNKEPVMTTVEPRVVYSSLNPFQIPFASVFGDKKASIPSGNTIVIGGEKGSQGSQPAINTNKDLMWIGLGLLGIVIFATMFKGGK